MVTVTSASPTAPTLFPLIPPPESITESDKVTIGCIAKNYLPDSVTFSWENKNNVSDSTITTKWFPSLLTAGTYTASSQAAVSAAEWKNLQPFYCKAVHSAGNKVVRVARQASTSNCCDPEMSVRAPPLGAFSGPYLNATITCTAANLCTKQATLQWLKKGQILDSGFTTTTPVLGGSSNSIRSELIVTKNDWNADVHFTCTVKEKDFTGTMEIHRSLFCQEDCNTDVHVKTIPPSYADIFHNKSAKLTCKISNIPYEQDRKALNVTWKLESDNKVLNTELGQLKDQGNGLGYIEATTIVCATEWNKGQTFTCKVAFPGLLPEPIEKTLKKLNGAPLSPPSVYVLPPPSEQLTLQETATITCQANHFYPSDIFVQWLQNDQPVNSQEYFTSEPTLEPKSRDRYFIYSVLNISAEDWAAGTTYTCVVGHEALPISTTQKTVDKNTEEAGVHLSFLDGIVDSDDYEELQNITSILSTFIILFLISLFYSATVTVIKVK